MVCCIVADLITNPTLTLNLSLSLKVSVGCVSTQTCDFLGVHWHIFSLCAFCMDSQRCVLFVEYICFAQ